ncbi:nitric oxide reductase NorF protein [Celeribacter baekdonensis]|uniref:Nitric oxide reductase NorF protein n=1 Tax=Celeribacter baekdonensis TaxID=875171 RepID=A0A1G7U124_9RHOB|nr:cytochrome C oxidase subunit IV family protein [Celeribacter baekdonensis]SDG41315.1 nitric oxide reductase NorF protein [Celeribacter baekdonensis]
MTHRSLYIAWALLVALSFGSTALSASGIWAQWPIVAGVAVMALAWQKARIILADYMGLQRAPRWRRGFDVCLTGLCLLMLALYAAPLVL